MVGPIAARFARAAGAGLAVAEAVLAGPAEIAVVGPAADPRTGALHRAALLMAPPGAVLALGEGEARATAARRATAQPRCRCSKGVTRLTGPRRFMCAGISPAVPR